MKKNDKNINDYFNKAREQEVPFSKDDARNLVEKHSQLVPDKYFKKFKGVNKMTAISLLLIISSMIGFLTINSPNGNSDTGKFSVSTTVNTEKNSTQKSTVTKKNTKNINTDNKQIIAKNNYVEDANPNKTEERSEISSISKEEKQSIKNKTKYILIDENEAEKFGIIIQDNNKFLIPVELINMNYMQKSDESIDKNNDLNIKKDNNNLRKNKLGIYFDYQLLNISDFMQYSNIPGYDFDELCDCFTVASFSEGYQAGFDYSYRINEYLKTGFRAGLGVNYFKSTHDNIYPSEIIERDPDTGDIIDRYLVENTTRHRNIMKYSFYTFEPYAEINFLKNFNIKVGPSFYYVSNDNAIFDLMIVPGELEDVKFESGNLQDGAVLSEDSTKIIYYNGDIPNKNTFFPGILVGLSYDLNIQNITISPEAEFRYNIKHLSRDDFWLVHHLNLGLSLYYRF